MRNSAVSDEFALLPENAEQLGDSQVLPPVNRFDIGPISGPALGCRRASGGLPARWRTERPHLGHRDPPGSMSPRSRWTYPVTASRVAGGR